MFLNEQLNEWQWLDSECEPVEEGQESVTCCSTHLTTFTVQQVSYKDGFMRANSVTGDSPSVSESNVIVAHLHFILFVNLSLFILVVTGCCLDRRQKLIFEPMHAKGAAEANSKGKNNPVSNSNLRDSINVPINVAPPIAVEPQQV